LVEAFESIDTDGSTADAPKTAGLEQVMINVSWYFERHPAYGEVEDWSAMEYAVKFQR